MPSTRLEFTPNHWQAWGHFYEDVRPGQTVVPQVFGMHIYPNADESGTALLGPQHGRDAAPPQMVQTHALPAAARGYNAESTRSWAVYSLKSVFMGH